MEHPVLVTGGAGYVGSHVCKLLDGSGYTPISFDSLEHGHRSLVRWGPLEVGDLADRGRLAEVMHGYRPEAVLHFAAYAYVGESMRDPGRYYRNNVSGTLNLLDAMVDRGVLRWSSPARAPRSAPPSERRSTRTTRRRRSTRTARRSSWSSASFVTTRPSIGCGRLPCATSTPPVPIPRVRAGELHDPETHLIPLVLDAAADARPSVDVYGDDYPTRDGSCVRDYVHVTDLAAAHVRALDHLAAGGPSTAFNLGTGTGSSVFEVIEQVRATTGRDVTVHVRGRRAGDPPELVAATGRAATELGWRPERSDLADIVGDA